MNMLGSYVYKFDLTELRRSKAPISDMGSRVRPRLGRWHRYVITCKTTSGTLASVCDYM
ncbi:ATP-dependent DNA helicase dda [Gossypium arboreum]|uniref:ATP-dependent DNA helicase dda n=1 Tax=Gossypium arboreum TaxID=29729 RepID=A0A0B0MGJ9_GOSAR|nr:ATP-dependent DNA helicase dda [Gossypium arboreum]